MALGDLSYWAVKQAVAEFDALGRETFLRKYGFGPARAYILVFRGKRYDSKAIAGAAHGYLKGEKPLKPSDFSGGENTVAKVLRDLKFRVDKLTGDEPRNPPWSRDELILALDFYMRHRPQIPGQTSKPIAELSNVLNELAKRLGGKSTATFRNANGVYMKAMNFRRLDPDVVASGQKGLTRGNKDEEVVWSVFANDPERLRAVAQAIRNEVQRAEVVDPVAWEDEDLEAVEGRVLTRVHRARERDADMVKKLKRKVLRTTGKLACEVCEFDFEDRYGARGRGFIEAHHVKPVHTLAAEGEKIRPEDMALVCSNCHRMIHASRPWLSVQELRALVVRPAAQRPQL